MLSRNNILFTLLVGYLFYAQPVRGQFATKRLALLAKSTGILANDSLISNGKDTVYYFHDRLLHVKKNQEGHICHIGYSLFNQSLRIQNPSIVYDFIERYLLELDLLSSDTERQQRNRLDKVVIQGDPTKFLSSNNENEKITINNEINHKYFVLWERGKRQLAMEFNADYQLILGANDLELEEIFANKLKKKAYKRNGEGDINLIYDRYGYVKDTIRFFRQDIISLIEEECKETSLRPKSATEDVMFAINRDLGFVHLASFKPDQARVITYIPIYDASEKFINQLVPQKGSDKYVEPDGNISKVSSGAKEDYMIIRELLRNIQNAIKEKDSQYIDSIFKDYRFISETGEDITNDMKKKKFSYHLRQFFLREKEFDVHISGMSDEDEEESLGNYIKDSKVKETSHFYSICFNLELCSNKYNYIADIFMIIEISYNKDPIIHLSIIQNGGQKSGTTHHEMEISLDEYI